MPNELNESKPSLILSSQGTNSAILKTVRSQASARGITCRVDRKKHPSGCDVGVLECPERSGASRDVLKLFDLVEGMATRRVPNSDLPPGHYLFSLPSDDILGVPISVHCPDLDIGEVMCKKLVNAGFRKVTFQQDLSVTGDRAYFNPNQPGSVNFLAWFLRMDGCPVALKPRADDNTNTSVRLDLLTPATHKIAGKIEVHIDDPTAIDAVTSEFRANGFEPKIKIVKMTKTARVQVDVGCLKDQEGLIARLLTIADTCAGTRSRADFPVERHFGRSRTQPPRVVLPIAALRSDILVPYAGDNPRRWPIFLYRDDKEAGQKLVENLRNKGFESITVRTLNGGYRDGFQVVRGGEAQESARIYDALRLSFDETMIDIDMLGHQVFYHSGEAGTITLRAPFGAARKLDKEGKLDNLACFHVILRAEEPENAFLQNRLRQLGYRDITHDTRPSDGDYIRYDSLSTGAVDKLRERLSPFEGGPEFDITERPNLAGREIIISMTEREDLRMQDNSATDTLVRPAADTRPRLADGIVSDAEAADAPDFVSRSGDKLRIGRIELTCPKDQQNTPGIDPGFTLDVGAARSLEFLATAMQRKQSALLIGETGCGKTAVIRHFAAIVGTPLHTIAMSDQTQLEDLVGQVSATENWWQWKDGAMITAFKNGGVVILDELNFAPAALIGRFNEAHDRRISRQEQGEDELTAAEHFLLTATSNPSDLYKGRSELSAEVIERFVGLEVPVPDEAAHLAFLRRCVFGETPALRVAGKLYRGGTATPLMPGLAELADIDALLARLARFHAEAEAAAARSHRGEGEAWTSVGRCRYSRRRLIRLLTALESDQAKGDLDPDRAIGLVYLNLLRPHAVAVVSDIATANGFDLVAG